VSVASDDEGSHVGDLVGRGDRVAAEEPPSGEPRVLEDDRRQAAGVPEVGSDDSRGPPAVQETLTERWRTLGGLDVVTVDGAGGGNMFGARILAGALGCDGCGREVSLAAVNALAVGSSTSGWFGWRA
jgi:hypothetical protein